jgi:hypothetical protein
MDLKDKTIMQTLDNHIQGYGKKNQARDSSMERWKKGEHVGIENSHILREETLCNHKTKRKQ